MSDNSNPGTVVVLVVVALCLAVIIGFIRCWVRKAIFDCCDAACGDSSGAVLIAPPAASAMSPTRHHTSANFSNSNPGMPYPVPMAGVPYPPTGAYYPPTGAPYPPTGAPYPPTGAPNPPTGAPYPPTGAHYPRSRAPTQPICADSQVDIPMPAPPPISSNTNGNGRPNTPRTAPPPPPTVPSGAQSNGRPNTPRTAPPPPPTVPSGAQNSMGAPPPSYECATSPATLSHKH